MANYNFTRTASLLILTTVVFLVIFYAIHVLENIPKYILFAEVGLFCIVIILIIYYFITSKESEAVLPTNSTFHTHDHSILEIQGKIQSQMFESVKLINQRTRVGVNIILATCIFALALFVVVIALRDQNWLVLIGAISPIITAFLTYFIVKNDKTLEFFYRKNHDVILLNTLLDFIKENPDIKEDQSKIIETYIKSIQDRNIQQPNKQ